MSNHPLLYHTSPWVRRSMSIVWERIHIYGTLQTVLGISVPASLTTISAMVPALFNVYNNDKKLRDSNNRRVGKLSICTKKRSKKHRSAMVIPSQSFYH